MIKEYNEWFYLSRYHNIHKSQSENIAQRIAKFSDRLDEIFIVKSIETESSSAETDTSESNFEMDYEMQQQEEKPGPSSITGSGVRKRRSEMEVEENVKHIFEKISNTDEEGKNSH